MAVITFFEKPGCINNARQKKMLKNAGHQLIERDLLNEPWSAGRLRPFFKSLRVAEWFNRSSPRIKSGEIIPESIDADSALKLMVEDPLLIRRPLMISGSLYLSGFDPDEVASMLGMAAEELVAAGDLERCVQISDHTCRVAEVKQA
ncbi:MAG: arsenate reductase family protein [Zetaproteobacteria bacterium CG12_big_fil_rev_8_21_14_0_65_54_13]|nr:MAG: arsenate reductase family protein [Zetaproteobacteria bacterium CG12_big_fil_rev_8_21_14_0_65_54_13]PIX54286.1 MAG: arsenate reductase family protein [Zetaproteobacteria bacterium CG_4_10_14_3_um_filter_54_28]PJA30431.1 MAG: arsenate reductase family protein [Zetaproteobacteria bacterium CG_4_9_14_3_um_filter_54_145]